MAESLKTLELEIAYTAEDPAIDATLPEIAQGEEILGTLSPALRKFLCLVEKTRIEFQEAYELAMAQPTAERDIRAEKCNIRFQTYLQSFVFAVATDLEKTHPNIWLKALFLNFRKGWTIVALPQIMFVTIENMGDDDDSNDPQEFMPPVSPKKKPRLN